MQPLSELSRSRSVASTRRATPQRHELAPVEPRMAVGNAQTCRELRGGSRCGEAVLQHACSVEYTDAKRIPRPPATHGRHGLREIAEVRERLDMRAPDLRCGARELLACRDADVVRRMLRSSASRIEASAHRAPQHAPVLAPCNVASSPCSPRPIVRSLESRWRGCGQRRDLHALVSRGSVVPAETGARGLSCPAQSSGGPPSPPLAGASGISVIVASVRSSTLATEIAFSRAIRTTLVGSMIPASTRST